jgi:hypothetical protein
VPGVLCLAACPGDRAREGAHQLVLAPPPGTPLSVAFFFKLSCACPYATGC